jgi:predicted HD phosphohydrolase
MRTIQDIYNQYDIMPNLREHMFRVAAVADIIIDHIDESVNREEIITALLLHDMGNIIKFDLSYFPEFLEPQGLKYWRKIQDEMRDKYGSDEHAAHIAITHEIGAGDRVAELVDSIGFHNLCKNTASDDWAHKICSYADLRVYPHGVVSLDVRLEDGRKRYNVSVDDERWDLIDCASKLEQQIFDKCSINPEDITDEALDLYIGRYAAYQIPV